MPIDTSIYNLLRPSKIRGLDPFVEGRASGLNFRRDLGAAQEEEAARARAEQTRQAYRERYGEAPGGLAGPAPAAAAPAGLGGEAYPPLAEQEAAATQQALYGSPGVATPMQAPSGPPPPGPYGQTMQAPSGPPPPGPYGQTLEDRAGQPVGPASQTMGAGGLGSQSPSQNPFISKLYTIDPAAGREAEKHAYESRKLELANAKERVEHLGRVADGVLAVQTQEAHNAARAMLIQDGMPANQIPVAYDPKIWQMFSGMATSSAERLRLGELQLDQAKFQYKKREEGSKAPDYGYTDTVNAALYARYGSEIPPGQPPSPAQVAQAEKDVLEGKVAVAGATGAEAARVAREDKPLEGEAATAMSELTTLQQLSDDAGSLFDPSYTGKLEGRWGAVKEWSGTSGSREVVFRRVIADMKDQLVRARSGKAMSEKEYARLSELVPNVTDADSVFQAKLLGFRRVLDQAKEARLEAATTGRRPLRESQPPVTPLPGSTAPAGTGAKRTTRAQIQGKLKPGWTIDQAVEYYRGQGYEVTP